MRLLVVDDDSSMLTYLQRLLRREGWDLTMARSGEEALEKYQQGPFGGVLMDVDLGAPLDGIQTAERLRGLDPNLKIVLMSADPTNRNRVLDSRFNVFLPKPPALRALQSAFDPSR